MDKVELPPIPTELLQSWPTQAQECVAAWHNLAQQLLLQNKLLQAQLAELQNQLNQNSQNSSKPPSSDPPFKRPPKTNNSKTKSPKAKGGQVGHTKQQRTLLEPDQVDLIITAPHPTCPNPTCQKTLTASEQVGTVLRQQVWELPPVKAHVTEYQTAHYLCTACHSPTRSQLPIPVPKGQFGLRLVATLALLHGQYQLSLRQVQALAQDLWQLPLSLGGLADACSRTSQALAEPYAQVQAQVRTAPTLHLDETGWYRSGKLTWLWVAVAPLATLFRVQAGRGKNELESLLGTEYTGYVHSDRWSPYLSLEASRHQLCWAHLIRNLRGLAQRAGPAAQWSEKLLAQAYQLFGVWHRYLETGKESDEARAKLLREVEPIRAEFKAGLEAGLRLADGKVKSFSKKLLGVEERLYLFVKVAGVAPTNNTAERALRPAVIWRKKCYGNQSERGEEFVERILSVSASCQQQQVNILGFVMECLKANWFSLETPQLFPLPSPL